MKLQGENAETLKTAFFLAEDGRADAEHGGAFFDGDFVVLAHSHGEVFEFGAGDAFTLDFLEDLARPSEAGADAVGVFGEGGHGHQPDEPQIGHGVELFGQVNGGADGTAVFLGFAGAVDLQEDIGVDAEFMGLCVDFLGQTQRVDGLDSVADFQRLADLVALQVADHVPVDLVGDRGIFGVVGHVVGDFVGNLFEMLGPVFTEVAQTCFKDLFNGLGRGGLGDHDELDGVFTAACTDARRSDGLLNLFDFICDHFVNSRLLIVSRTTVPCDFILIDLSGFPPSRE